MPNKLIEIIVWLVFFWKKYYVVSTLSWILRETSYIHQHHLFIYKNKEWKIRKWNKDKYVAWRNIEKGFRKATNY